MFMTKHWKPHVPVTEKIALPANEPNQRHSADAFPPGQSCPRRGTSGVFHCPSKQEPPGQPRSDHRTPFSMTGSGYATT